MANGSMHALCASLCRIYTFTADRSKNIASILVLSVIDTLISAIGYYLVGFAFTLGDGNPSNSKLESRS